MADPLVVQKTFESIAGFILEYAITLAALGALTVGLLEAYKKLFNTLAKFQRSALLRWLAEENPDPGQDFMLRRGHYGVSPDARAVAHGELRREPVEVAETYATPLPDPYDGAKAYAELLHLTTGVWPDEHGLLASGKNGPFHRNVGFALFELDLAKMMSQIQEAADAALNNPTRYGHWFQFLTRGCDRDDVARWLEAMTAGAPLGVSGEAQRQEIAEVYARIRLLMRRQLDSFQTITSYRWREWNQLWAWAVGAVLLLLAQLIQAVQVEGAAENLTPFRLATMVAFSLAGGILAPIAKDLVDALGKVKSGG